MANVQWKTLFGITPFSHLSIKSPVDVKWPDAGQQAGLDDHVISVSGKGRAGTGEHRRRRHPSLLQLALCHGGEDGPGEHPHHHRRLGLAGAVAGSEEPEAGLVRPAVRQGGDPAVAPAPPGREISVFYKVQPKAWVYVVGWVMPKILVFINKSDHRP